MISINNPSAAAFASGVAASHVAGNLISGNKLVTVSAWLTMRRTDLLANDVEKAAQLLYEAVRADIGEELACDDEDSLHPIYKQAIELARTHGLDKWPIAGLESLVSQLFADRDDEDLAESSGRLWDDALAAYEEHRAKARRRQGIFLS
jgi:hypothetical protein